MLTWLPNVRVWVVTLPQLRAILLHLRSTSHGSLTGLRSWPHYAGKKNKIHFIIDCVILHIIILLFYNLLIYKILHKNSPFNFVTCGQNPLFEMLRGVCRMWEVWNILFLCYMCIIMMPPPVMFIPTSAMLMALWRGHLSLESRSRIIALVGLSHLRAILSHSTSTFLTGRLFRLTKGLIFMRKPRFQQP